MSTSRIMDRSDVVRRITAYLQKTDGVSLSDIYNNVISIVCANSPEITYEENDIFIEDRIITQQRMTDRFLPLIRSQVMKAVHSKGNKSTELSLINIFRSNSVKGWRRNYKLFGSPDFVFPKKHIAIFADGCFWHGHNCRNTKPKQHASYWANKILRKLSVDWLLSLRFR